MDVVNHLLALVGYAVVGGVPSSLSLFKYSNTMGKSGSMPDLMNDFKTSDMRKPKR